MEGHLSVTVRAALSGNLLGAFDVSASETVWALKEVLQKSTGRLAFRQKMIHEGDILDDQTPLSTLAGPLELDLLDAPLVASDGKQLLEAAFASNTHAVRHRLCIPEDPDGLGFLEGGGGTHTPLAIASAMGHLQVVRLLRAAGASVNFADHRIFPALYHAVIRGHVHIVDDLCAAGANPNIRGIQGRSPLLEAILLQEVEMVKRLCDASADVHLADSLGKQTPISAALHRLQEASSDLESALRLVDMPACQQGPALAWCLDEDAGRSLQEDSDVHLAAILAVKSSRDKLARASQCADCLLEHDQDSQGSAFSEERAPVALGADEEEHIFRACKLPGGAKGRSRKPLAPLGDLEGNLDQRREGIVAKLGRLDQVLTADDGYRVFTADALEKVKDDFLVFESDSSGDERI